MEIKCYFFVQMNLFVNIVQRKINIVIKILYFLLIKLYQPEYLNEVGGNTKQTIILHIFWPHTFPF